MPSRELLSLVDAPRLADANLTIHATPARVRGDPALSGNGAGPGDGLNLELLVLLFILVSLGTAESFLH